MVLSTARERLERVTEEPEKDWRLESQRKTGEADKTCIDLDPSLALAESNDGSVCQISNK